MTEPSLTVRCPECGAEPGEPCATPNDVARPRHRARLFAAMSGPQGNGDRNWLSLACVTCGDCTPSARVAPDGKIPQAQLTSEAVRLFIARHPGHDLRGLHSATRLWFDISDLAELEPPTDHETSQRNGESSCQSK